MAVQLLHRKTADGTGNNKVLAGDWNDNHALTGSANTLLAFDSNGEPVDLPQTDFGGVPALVYAETYGAVGDGVSDDTSAIQAAINAVGALGGGIVRLTPNNSYFVTTLILNLPNVEIDATGATVTSSRTTSTTTVAFAAQRCAVKGGMWLLTGGSDQPWHFNVNAPNCRIYGKGVARKTPEAGGYNAYFHSAGDNLTVDQFDFEGSNGFYMEMSNSTFTNFNVIGRATGGDDCFALKAINDNNRNNMFDNIYVENMASVISIGSEIGVQGANDPNYTRTVGQIGATNIRAKNCYGLLFCKPGGIDDIVNPATYDYRDGTAEDIIIDNVTLIDELGTKMERPIAITPSRGARARNISITNVKVRGRTTVGTGGRRVVADIFIPDYGTGTAETLVSDVTIQVEYHDRYEGVANGVGGAPGHPIKYMAAVQAATYGVGNFENISISISANGSSEAGALVGPSSPAKLDEKVEFHRLRMYNSNTSGTGAGIIFGNKVRIIDPYYVNDVAAGSATSFSGTGEIISPFEGATSIVGITGTKAEFDTAVTDGNFLFSGDLVGVTDGDKGDVVVSGSGATWTVEGATGAFTVGGVTRLNDFFRVEGGATFPNGSGLEIIFAGTTATMSARERGGASAWYDLVFRGATIDVKPNGTSVGIFSPTGLAMSQDITVPDEAYGSGWDGSTEVPTKNALFDKLETFNTASSRLHSAITSVGTPASTVETDLQTYTLPADTLNADGRLLRITSYGTLAATTRSRTVKLYIGGVQIGLIGPSTTSSLQSWGLCATVVRRGSASEICFTETPVNTGSTTTIRTSLTLDLTTPLVIKVTGQSGGSAVANDVACDIFTVELV